MRQVMYISDSLIGYDTAALERIMVQARTNNAMDGITGLLWTDGHRFAQVIEGGAAAIADLWIKLERDPRHANLRIVHDAAVSGREFGAWTMAQPSADPATNAYERRMRTQLSWLSTELSGEFERVVAGARTP